MEKYITYNKKTQMVEINDEVRLQHSNNLLSDKQFIFIDTKFEQNISFKILTSKVHTEWRVKTNNDWIKPYYESGCGKAVVWCNIKENNTSSKRIGMVTIEYGKKQRIIYIMQDYRYRYTFDYVRVNTPEYIERQISNISDNKGVFFEMMLNNTANTYGILTIGKFKIGVQNGMLLFNGGKHQLSGGMLKGFIDKYGLRINGTMITTDVRELGELTLRLSSNISFVELNVFKLVNNEYVMSNNFKPTLKNDRLILLDLIQDNEIDICDKSEITETHIQDISIINPDSIEFLRMLEDPQSTSIQMTVQSISRNWEVSSDCDWLFVKKLGDDMTFVIRTTDNKYKKRTGTITISEWEYSKTYTVVQNGSEEYETAFAVNINGIGQIDTKIKINKNTDNILCEYASCKKDNFIYGYDDCSITKDFINPTKFITEYTNNENVISEGNLLLFGENTNINLKRFKVFRNNKPILEYIPIIKDGRYGLLNLVSSEYIFDDCITNFNQKRPKPLPNFDNLFKKDVKQPIEQF